MIIKFEMLREQFDALWGETEAGALSVKHILVLGRSQVGEGVWQDINVRGNPLGDPHKLVQDLLGRDEPRHSETKLVLGAPVGKQVV